MSGEETKGSGTAAGASSSSEAGVAAPSKGPAVFAFGRFQPPHAGHGVLISGVGRLAAELGGTGFVFATSTHNSVKNPLKVEEKVFYLQKMFPDAGVEFINTTISGTRTLDKVIAALKSSGYAPIFLAVGSDRVADFAKFEDSVVKLVKIGEERREENESNFTLAGLSASKMRKAAKSDNRATFEIGTKIGHMENINVKQLMDTIKERIKGGRRRYTLRRRARRTTRKGKSKN
jgi:nicotinamide mononucleotide adenylyltransferase